MQYLKSIVVWVYFVISLVCWCPYLWIVYLFDKDPVRYNTGYCLRRFGRMLIRVNFFWKIKISGTLPENPRKPYIVVCNHQSFADIPLISCLPWDMKWVTKQEVFDVPLLGWMLKLSNDIPVKRDDNRSRAMALIRAKEILSQQCSVMFFPEGTRTRDGKVGLFAEALFRMAIQNKIEILPLAIDGSMDCLPRNSWKFGKAREIKLHVFSPVQTEGLTTDDTKKLASDVRNRIVEQIATWRNVLPESVSG